MEQKFSLESELYLQLRRIYINRDPFRVYESDQDPAIAFALWLKELGVRVEFSLQREEPWLLDALGMHPNDLLWVTPNPQLTLLVLQDPIPYQRV